MVRLCFLSLLFAYSLISSNIIFTPIILDAYNPLDGSVYKISLDGEFFYQIDYRHNGRVWKFILNEGIQVMTHICPQAHKFKDIYQYSPYRIFDVWENTFFDKA